MLVLYSKIKYQPLLKLDPIYTYCWSNWRN